MLSGCGLGKKEVVENNKNSKIIFEKSKPITKELNPNLKIKLTKLIKGEVFLGNNSYVWQQALNRVHVQKSILLYSFGKLR